jgi:hypothetical protein
MASNDAANEATQGRVWKPRLQVFIGSGGMLNVGAQPTTQISFPISANCIRSNFFAADRFKIVCSLYADSTQSDDFWSEFTDMNVAVLIGFESTTAGSAAGTMVVPYTQIFRGVADKIEFDLIKGTVSVTGRNFAALMIDSTLQSFDLNTPMTDVINTIATRHGLTTDLPGVPAGQTYGSMVGGDKGGGQLGFQTNKIGEWELLTTYAAFLGNVVYELNGVLYFVPSNATNATNTTGAGFGGGNTWYCQAPNPVFNAVPGAATGQGAGGVTTLGDSNATSLKVTHDYQFSQYAQTTAVLHNHHKPETILYKYPADEDLPADLPIKRFYFETQNKTDDDMTMLIQNYHNVMNYREWLLEWKFVGPDMLQANIVDVVEVSGTNSQVDGEYSIASIEWDISFSRGFTQTIKGVWGRTT